MNANLKEYECNIIQLSRTGESVSFDTDFDSLIPPINEPVPDDIDMILAMADHRKPYVGMDALPENIFNDMLEVFLSQRKFRSAFWLTTMANFGVRYSDVAKIRRRDVIDSQNKFRPLDVWNEQKTSKLRTMYINNAVKMALLMLIWNGDYEPNDYLIYSQGKRKGFETVSDPNNKRNALRINGKLVYKLDENGNKIPKPLSRMQTERIMKHAIIDELNIPLLNDIRTQSNGNIALCTHSVRKMYGEKIVQMFIENFDQNTAYARQSAIAFLQWDYGHTSQRCTTVYTKENDRIKQQLNMKMNLGIDVLSKYFEIEKQKYLSKKN